MGKARLRITHLQIWIFGHLQSCFLYLFSNWNTYIFRFIPPSAPTALFPWKPLKTFSTAPNHINHNSVNQILYTAWCCIKLLCFLNKKLKSSNPISSTVFFVYKFHRFPLRILFSSKVRYMSKNLSNGKIVCTSEISCLSRIWSTCSCKARKLLELCISQHLLLENEESSFYIQKH